MPTDPVPNKLASADPSTPVEIAQGTRPEDYAEPLPGERLDDFLILEKLHSEGGFGVIYRGEDCRDKKPVAIKVMKPDKAAVESNRARFERECTLLCNLDHPHVVRLYGHGTVRRTDGRCILYLAMELLQGRTLDQYVRSNGPLSVREVLRYGQQLADGLAEIHARGCLHRDIKLSNIWLLSAGAGVKIIDLGMVKPVADANPVTEAGKGVGTLPIAPEQLAGAAEMRSDLYGLGIVLYEMGTGLRPDREARPDERGVMTPRHPSDVSGSFPRPLGDVVLRLLRPEAAERYASAREVQKILRACEEDLDDRDRLIQLGLDVFDLAEREYIRWPEVFPALGLSRCAQMCLEFNQILEYLRNQLNTVEEESDGDQDLPIDTLLSNAVHLTQVYITATNISLRQVAFWPELHALVARVTTAVEHFRRDMKEILKKAPGDPQASAFTEVKKAAHRAKVNLEQPERQLRAMRANAIRAFDALLQARKE